MYESIGSRMVNGLSGSRSWSLWPISGGIQTKTCCMSFVFFSNELPLSEMCLISHKEKACWSDMGGGEKDDIIRPWFLKSVFIETSRSYFQQSVGRGNKEKVKDHHFLYSSWRHRRAVGRSKKKKRATKFNDFVESISLSAIKYLIGLNRDINLWVTFLLSVLGACAS